MTRGPRLAALGMASALAGCASAPNAVGDASGSFSLVVGVPPEWVSRLDQARYLEPTDCAALCPAPFASRVMSCHLARVAGAKTTPDTAAVVCNGGAEVQKP